jgi:hypothetical protein
MPLESTWLARTLPGFLSPAPAHFPFPPATSSISQACATQRLVFMQILQNTRTCETRFQLERECRKWAQADALFTL